MNSNIKGEEEQMQPRQMSLFTHESGSPGTFLNISEKLGFPIEPQWPDKFGKSLSIWAREKIKTPIRTMSLFSGCGGLDIGFHDAGFMIQAMVEIDERFVETLRNNHGAGQLFDGVEINCLDIRNYLPPKGASIDFIIGGPPCQTFSAAGRRAAGVKGIDDERGTLFEEYVRLLHELSPRGFLFENVYGITGAQNGEAWSAIREAFEEAGYHVFYRILDAADYGVPQHRERLFIVGTKDREYRFPQPTHGPDSPDMNPYFSAAEAIANVFLTEEEREAKVGGRFGHLLNDIPPGLNYSFYTEKMGHPQPVFAWRSKFSDFLYKADPNAPVRTIKAQGGQYTGPFHWENRPFSIRELKRLQTIPDNYKIVGGTGTAIHQIGNSVPPQLARILALSILEQIFDIELPFELRLLQPGQELGFRKRKRERTSLYRKKARIAIQAIEQDNKEKKVTKRNYRATLSEDFEWLEIDNVHNPNASEVHFYPSKDTWEICIGRAGESSCSQFSIKVQTRPRRRWALETENVQLVGGELEPSIFTGLWKAFEAEVVRFGIKADLVQLNGYYQYTPALKGRMEFKHANPDQKWLVVQKVVSGVGVRSIMSSSELAMAWDTSEEDVIHYARFLKSLGYEVRNQNTNPQIPKGHFLIPYAFPTLTPLSVQLRKSLEGNNEPRQ